jgi:hypothetical protein
MAISLRSNEAAFLYSLAFTVLFFGFIFSRFFTGRFHMEGSILSGLVFMCLIGLFLSFQRIWSEEFRAKEGGDV